MFYSVSTSPLFLMRLLAKVIGILFHFVSCIYWVERNLSFSLFLRVKKATPTLPDLDLNAEP